MATYEATVAHQTASIQPDPIHWSTSTSYRKSPYRHLHHQDGLIGTLQVRLLEASGLKRSYWSALALGPVKHLGLSKAYGPISSYATFSVDFRDDVVPFGGDEQVSSGYGAPSRSGSVTPVSTSSGLNSPMTSPGMRSPNPHDPRRVSQPFSSSLHGSSSVQRLSFEEGADASSRASSSSSSEVFRSSVVQQNSDPVWTNADVSKFDIPIRKGAARRDGMRPVLRVRMDEEMTAAEAIIPGGRGGKSGGDERMIGEGEVDVGGLCLGEDGDGGDRVAVGIVDVWVTLTLPSAGTASAASASPAPEEKAGKEKGKEDGAGGETGRVRVLISYEPNGLTPSPNDIVALEGFARRSARFSSCRPLLPPLQPLKVLAVRGSYLQVQYVMDPPADRAMRDRAERDRRRRNGTLRLHRNAVFVIERTNLVDNAVNVALAPADILLDTPLGRKTTEVAGPYVEAAGDLVMPAVLSAKLIFAAAKTTATASLSGLSAATATVVAAQDPNNRRRGTGRYGGNSVVGVGGGNMRFSGEEQFV